MSFTKIFKSWTPHHFLGLSVIMVMGLGAVIISQSGADEIKNSGLRNIASMLNPNQYLSQLTATDRTRLRRQYLESNCVNKRGQNYSCGYTRWPANGDSRYNSDPYMNRIPHGTKVQVSVQCDPRSGRFFTNIYFPHICPNNADGSAQNKNCGQFYFQNPYTAEQSQSRMSWQRTKVSPFSSTPTNWPASPGQFNRDDMTNLTGQSSSSVNMTQLGASLPNGASNAVEEFHVVSDRKAWEGAIMTNVLWLRGDIAIHGSSNVTGRPESRGCIRLRTNDAFALYNLARRVGTQNISYKFSGYGPTKQFGNQRRPACSLSSKEWNIMAKSGQVPVETPAQATARRQTAQKQSRNAFQAIGDFFRRIFGGKQRRATPTYPSNSDR